MTRNTRSDQDQVHYWLYDDRSVSRTAIEQTLQALDEQARRRERIQRFRTWTVTALIVLVFLAAVVALLWWRLTSPF
jgi:hypothetical protein